MLARRPLAEDVAHLRRAVARIFQRAKRRRALSRAVGLDISALKRERHPVDRPAVEVGAHPRSQRIVQLPRLVVDPVGERHLPGDFVDQWKTAVVHQPNRLVWHRDGLDLLLLRRGDAVFIERFEEIGADRRVVDDGVGDDRRLAVPHEVDGLLGHHPSHSFRAGHAVGVRRPHRLHRLPLAIGAEPASCGWAGLREPLRVRSAVVIGGVPLGERRGFSGRLKCGEELRWDERELTCGGRCKSDVASGCSRRRRRSRAGRIVLRDVGATGLKRGRTNAAQRLLAARRVTRRDGRRRQPYQRRQPKPPRQTPRPREPWAAADPHTFSRRR